ncbi:MAG: hypothetical protein ILP10_08150, partial [Lachnospiraceae bacterium]|nr:hypothetical protein [Lachnospiraceae bacterium]
MMTEKEAIEIRHSVRSYTDRLIDDETVGLIEQKIEELNKEGNLNLRFVREAGKTYNKIWNRFSGLGSAP